MIINKIRSFLNFINVKVLTNLTFNSFQESEFEKLQLDNATSYSLLIGQKPQIVLNYDKPWAPSFIK